MRVRRLNVQRVLTLMRAGTAAVGLATVCNEATKDKHAITRLIARPPQSERFET